MSSSSNVDSPKRTATTEPSNDSAGFESCLSPRSLAERARVFDKSYVESPRKKAEGINALKALLDASLHRRMKRIGGDGSISNIRDPNDTDETSEIISTPSRQEDPILQALMDASRHRKKHNVTDGFRPTYGPPSSSSSVGTIQAQPIRLGARMQKLLDYSRHKKLLKTCEHRLAHRMILHHPTDQASWNESSHHIPLFTFNLRKVKNRIKPSLPSGVEPLKPTETTFHNVVAPRLEVNVATFQANNFPKTPEQTTLIQEAMSTTYVLKYQSPVTAQALVDVMEPLDFRKGQLLQRQGDPVRPDEDQLYIVEEGQLQVQVDGKVVRTIQAGETFGQERLLYRPGSTAVTLRAAGAPVTKVFTLPQVTFRVVQIQHYRRVLDELKAKTPKIDDSTTWRDDIYNDPNAQEERDEELSFGDYMSFDDDGSESELDDNDTKKPFSEDGSTDTDDADSFAEVHSEARSSRSESISMSVTTTSEHKTMSVSTGKQRPKSSPVIRRHESIRKSALAYANSKDDLELIKVLGEGQFGKVWLVAATFPDQEPARHEFALKAQAVAPEVDEEKEEIDEEEEDDDEEDDEHIVRLASRAAIRSEVRALQALRHPFICNLIHTYETENSFDLLMGLIPGGELWAQIHRKQANGSWISGIPEGRARFFTFVLTHTLGFIHSRNMVYRDLKPENVMLDADGYPIIVDFGFAKFLEPGEKTHTFCGTPNYVAPEVILSAGHGKEVDFWALGVLLYEMISGDNPFYTDGMEQEEMYEAIVEEVPYEMREGITATDQVRELTDLLLIKDPQERLGAFGFQEVIDHPWFIGMPDKSSILSKKLSAEEASELIFDEEQSLADGEEDIPLQAVDEDESMRTFDEVRPVDLDGEVGGEGGSVQVDNEGQASKVSDDEQWASVYVEVSVSDEEEPVEEDDEVVDEEYAEQVVDEEQSGKVVDEVEMSGPVTREDEQQLPAESGYTESTYWKLYNDIQSSDSQGDLLDQRMRQGQLGGGQGTSSSPILVELPKTGLDISKRRSAQDDELRSLDDGLTATKDDDSTRQFSVSTPTKSKEKLRASTNRRKNYAGYYVSVLSPTDRENSKHRRGLVDSFLSLHLEGIDGDGDDVSTATETDGKKRNSMNIVGDDVSVTKGTDGKRRNSMNTDRDDVSVTKGTDEKGRNSMNIVRDDVSATKGTDGKKRNSTNIVGDDVSVTKGTEEKRRNSTNIVGDDVSVTKGTNEKRRNSMKIVGDDVSVKKGKDGKRRNSMSTVRDDVSLRKGKDGKRRNSMSTVRDDVSAKKGKDEKKRVSVTKGTDGKRRDSTNIVGDDVSVTKGTDEKRRNSMNIVRDDVSDTKETDGKRRNSMNTVRDDVSVKKGKAEKKRVSLTKGTDGKRRDSMSLLLS